MRIALAASLALLALVELNSDYADAQTCSFSIPNINFGNLIVGSPPPTVSVNLTGTCTGGAANAGRTITVCPNLGEGQVRGNVPSPRYLAGPGTRIGYDLLQANGGIWGSYLWPYGVLPPVFAVTLDASGNGTLSKPIQATITGNFAASTAGTYQSTYTTQDTAIDYGYSNQFTCSATPSARTVRPTFNVQANNQPGCSISAAAVNFGSVANLTTSKAASGQVSVVCTNGAPYTLTLSNGVTGTGPTTRLMRDVPATHTLTYGLYRDAAATLPWGTTTQTQLSGNGTGLNQNWTVFGILPAQATTANGTYSDTVIATINY